MDSPFFTNHRWYQQPDSTYRPYHSSVRGVPVYHMDPTPEDHQPAERASGPKVVWIPVQFVGSERLDWTGSAVKIQKVLRGFLVRKRLRKIKDIKIKVDEIEERLKSGEVVELVKKDANERLRMNETLMSLLIKLDSIDDVDFGVRGCRKAVIRKAIALQEMIDAIVAADLNVKEKGKTVDLETEARFPDGAENCAHPVDLKDSCESERVMEVEGGENEVGIVDVGVDCEVKVSEGCDDGREEKGNGKTNRELLEKMMKENEQMMRMMSGLFERSEAQTRMLDALRHRMKTLEKALVCDRMRRKKKKDMQCN